MNSSRAIIVGAGMSGLCMGVRLRQAGIESFTILEKASGIGGTWWDNTYPGAQCDVLSHLYTFSFAPNPDWSRRFSPQPEIQRYMEGVAQRFGLVPKISFNTEVVAARFDQQAALWTVETRGGETYTAPILVISMSPLHTPHVPEVPGLDSFRGTVFHSARWPAEFNPAGRRIAVIGNAASAVQFVPEIAPAAERLTVFQRSAHWIIARPDRPHYAWEKALFRIRPIERLHRWWQYWRHEFHRLLFEQGSAAGRIARAQALRHLRSQVADPALRAKLIPDYPMGCKRILLTNEYYPALQRPNVELVTTPIERIEADAVVTSDGTRYPVDAIVCATGFTVANTVSSIHITGPNGASLEQIWSAGARAYHGTTHAGFPNLFFLFGPNTATGHTSALLYIEPQTDYVIRCMREIESRGSRWLDVRPEALERADRETQGRLQRTVWAAGCRSWYKRPDGRIEAIYPGYSFQFARELRDASFGDYVFG